MTTGGPYAPYGYGLLGEFVFGSPPTISVSSTISITPVSYNGLQINWTYTGPTRAQQILVRSSYGVPSSIYASDGAIILNELSSGGFSAQYIDTGLQSGHFYYYALFVLPVQAATPQSGDDYLMSGSAQGLVLTDWGFGNTFASWMPDWYLEGDASLTTIAQSEGPLVRFLNLLGYEMDWIRSEIESLFLLTNVEQISGALLPALGANYGIGYEPELGMTRSRVLIQNAVYLYKWKGTAVGIAAAASAYSGYGMEIGIGKNLEIQLDDAAFDESIGHWQPLNATTSLSIIPASQYGLVPPHTLWAPMPTDPINGIQGYLPISNENVLQISGNSNIVEMNRVGSNPNPYNAQTLGIPITQSATPQTYVASAYFYPAPITSPVLQSFYLTLDWYDINGAYISSHAGAAVTEVSSTWVRAYVTGTPPAHAYYLDHSVYSVNALGLDTHLMDAVQIEINTQATPGPTQWQPPRDIQLNLLPVRQNLFVNPTGRIATTTAWTTTNATLAVSHAAVSWPAETIQGFLLTPNSSSTASMGATMAVDPGVSYTLSWYFRPVTAIKTFEATIQWKTSGGTNIGSAVTSTVTTEVLGSFVQGSIVNVVAPLTAGEATVTLSILSPTSSQGHYMGAPLFAPEGALLPYFDATFAPLTDYLFEGTANNSISDYYPSLPARISRLAGVLAEYVPMGSTYSIFCLSYVPSSTVTAPVTPPVTSTAFYDWDDSLDTWDNASDTWDS